MTKTDPIYAVIERHRKATKAWSDALLTRDRLEGTSEQAETHADATDSREWDAAQELIATQPETLAGALAVLRYVTAYYKGESEVFPGVEHDLLRHEDFLSFVDGIGDAIKAAIPA